MDAIAKGQHAKRLLADEILQEAFNVVKSNHVKVFEDAAATDDQVIEARRNLLALESIKRQLKNFEYDGKRKQKDQDRGSD